MIIGLTGGVGSGKSTVLEILRDKYKANIIQADKVAHDLMLPGSACYDEIMEKFGTTNRKILGEISFNNAEKLKELSDIIHPEVRRTIEKKVRRFTFDEPERLIVIEAALLIEAGYESLCDQMWCVVTDLDVRKQRLMESRGYTAEKVESIISHQLKDCEFIKHCDYVIDNSKDLPETYKQIEKILEF